MLPLLILTLEYTSMIKTKLKKNSHLYVARNGGCFVVCLGFFLGGGGVFLEPYNFLFVRVLCPKEHSLWDSTNQGKDCRSDLPPLTSPLVQIADMETVVMVVTTEDSRIMTDVRPIPACPVIHVRRRNNITPKMFSKHRTWLSNHIMKRNNCLICKIEMFLKVFFFLFFLFHLREHWSIQSL